MIYESQPYKEELGKIYLRMHKRQSQKRWTDQSYFLLERDFFVAFFLIRKLLEAQTKLTKAMENKEINLIKFPSMNKSPTILNHHDLENLYDIKNGHKITKDLKFVCDQMVHSYAFSPIHGKAGIEGILVNSFNERKKSLYQMSMKEVLSILRSVGNCYVGSITMMYVDKLGDYQVVKSS